jgi:hypothetical protein
MEVTMERGEEIYRSFCNTFDAQGNTVPPKLRYADLSPEDKIIYLEWRDDQICEEANEERYYFLELLYPLRPHSSKRDREKCTTYYDGCNCKPDHTQEEWLALRAENAKLKAEIENIMRRCKCPEVNFENQ